MLRQGAASKGVPEEPAKLGDMSRAYREHQVGFFEHLDVELTGAVLFGVSADLF